MTPEAVLDQARAAGLVLTPSGDTLCVSPADRLTPELRAMLMAHKPALLTLLRSEVRDALTERITLSGGVIVSLRALRLSWQLEARGHILTVRDRQLHVTPDDGLTALDRDRIERHHDELLTLASYDVGVT